MILGKRLFRKMLNFKNISEMAIRRKIENENFFKKRDNNDIYPKIHNVRFQNIPNIIKDYILDLTFFLPQELHIK